MRKYVVFLHRWVGLAVLAFIAIAAITGTIIAFDDELDRVLNDDWYFVQPQGQHMPMDQLVPIAQTFAEHSRVTFVRMDPDPARSYHFYLSTKPANGEGKMIRHNVFVDPYTGKILGGRENGEFGLDKRHLIPFLVKFHYTLFLGDFGKFLMGIAALLWLLDHFGAVYLSFPSLKNWRKSFQFRWREVGHKLNFDMHRSGSMWILPVLLALSLSSVYLNLNPQFKWVVGQFSPVTKTECACHVDIKAGWLPQSSSWDGAIHLAQQNKPELTPSAVTFLPDTGRLIVSMRGPEDLADNGMTKIYVNATNGKLLHIHNRSQETAADTFLAWQLPLHSGRVFGITGQIIILLSGIVITVICVTGFLIYAKKAKARELKAKQNAPAMDPTKHEAVVYAKTRDIHP